ncbi:ATPase V1 complex subunit H [Basidiobolus meristosporus CBS 931.73]|uniref:V-type proton ATPase subunit H n=1 Tax=Basidiobolus meristosporus CBS 931.73 TaxID=1314790 RepID=A0A1Y1Y042_9FUNG|nr:ATPase V1 complex subunit H [Basidiobolus meristosporus CBS 931.73]|eukprot:ORX91370.1 ATPase V1 complex subunit H [Basidiobolus meristosporus CBS 931.73]
MAEIFPTSLVSNPHLEELTSAARQKPVLWEECRGLGLISEEELRILSIYDKSGVKLQEVSQEEGAVLAQALVNLTDKLTRTDTLQRLLVLMDDILEGKDTNAAFFHETSVGNAKLPYAPLLKCLTKDDDFLALKSSKILTTLLSTAKKPAGVDLKDFFQWIAAQLQSKNANVADIAVQNLESLLRVSNYRVQFYETRNGVSSLADLLERSGSNSQMQYQIIFCFWLLTFEKHIAEEVNAKYDVIPAFLNVAKASVKEKVIRVVFATYRNLLEKAPEENMAALLVHKILNFTKNLATRKWSDPDIIDDLEYIRAELEENFQSLTTFDEYVSELESGKLSWSPAHQSEQFWAQNSSRLNENDYELLKRLSRLLATSNDPLVLAVGAHDVGQYVKHFANGKKVVQDIGAKQRIMELMAHESSDVRYQALLAVQKLMVHAWA